MSEPLTKDPYLPPSAQLDEAPVRSAASVGRFWGMVFALPVLGVMILTLLGNLRMLRAGDWGSGIVLPLAFLLPAVSILASGEWWASRVGTRRGFHYPLASLILATLWLGLLMGIAETGWWITEHRWQKLNRSDVLVTPVIWLCVSVYALVQGLLIRWRVRRLVRPSLTQPGP